MRNWRLWQWLVVSVVIGVILGFAFSHQDVDDPSLPSTSLGEFVRKLALRTDKGESIIRSVRVSPPTMDASQQKMQAVTFWEMMRRKSTGVYEPVRKWRFYTPVPLVPNPPRPDYDILDYLAERHGQTPGLSYGLNWWQTPRNMYLLCIGGSVLIIGVLWPMLLRLMARLGLIPPIETGFDLSDVRSSSAVPVVASTKGVSFADRDQLDAMNDQLQANVAGMAVGQAPTSKYDAAAEQAIRELPNAPDDTPALAAQPKPGDDEYQGEYYPVVKPTGKKRT